MQLYDDFLENNMLHVESSLTKAFDEEAMCLG